MLIQLRRVLLGAFTVGLLFSISLAQASLAALTVLWIWRLRDSETRARIPWPLVPALLAVILSTLLAALLSDWPGSSLLAMQELGLMATLFVATDALDDVAAADRFVSAVVVLAAIVASVGLLQVLACPTDPPGNALLRWFFRKCDRARGFYSIYMTLAGVLLVALLVALPRVLPGGPMRRWFLAPWLITLCGLAATYTRGAWLGLAGGALSLVAVARRGRWLVILGLVVVVAGALLGPGRLSARFRSIADPADPTIRERIHMWESGVAMWRDHPWLGVGPGGVKRLFPQYALPEAQKKKTSHMHSSPLQMLVENGLIGFAAWLWVWVAFYLWTGRLLARLPPDRPRERALVLGSLLAVTGFLVGGLSEHNYGDEEVLMVVWSVVALPFVVGRAVGPAHDAVGVTPATGTGGLEGA